MTAGGVQDEVLCAVAVEVAADRLVGPVVADPGVGRDGEVNGPAGQAGRGAEEDLERDRWRP